MTSNIVNILERQGAKLFHDNQEYYFNLEDEIAELPFQGYAVVVPKQIYVNKQNELPVVVFSRSTGLRGWEVSEHLNMMFAIRDTNTGKLWMKRVLTSNKYEEQFGSRIRVPGPKPNEISATSIGTVLKKIDALTKFDIPWATSTLSVTAISYDWVSNTTQIELLGDHKQELKPLPVSPEPAKPKGEELPSYLASSKSPKAKPNSLSFNIENSSSSGAYIIVDGSFSKKLRKNEIKQVPGTIRDHGNDQQVVGVVPITFAILGLDWREPEQQTINVPVYKIYHSTESANAYFHVKITPEYQLEKGQYVVYAFMEGQVIGPQKFEIK